MTITDRLTNKLYKWVVLYPWFRRLVNFAYSDLMKMPQYHINLAPGQIGEYVLLVDDPQDAEKAAAFLADPQEIAHHREYRSFTGTLDCINVSVVSLGIGGPPAAIGVHELAEIGATTFIYLGNGFAPSQNVKLGDLVIPLGAVRNEGTALQYAPLAFPAIPDVQIANCLRAACAEQNTNYHSGLIRSTDAYYNIDRSDANNYPHILCTDINTAAIFIVASVLKKRVGALLAVSKKIKPLTSKQIRYAVEALQLLITFDKNKFSNDSVRIKKKVF